MKKLTRLTAALLAALLFLSVSALAKQEIVYANLNSSGDVEVITIVNTFPHGGSIVDYGDYDDVRSVIGAQNLRHSGDTVTLEAGEQSVSFQGSLNRLDLPWHFDIGYMLDDMPIDAADLGGQSGRLQIDISARPNESVRAAFFRQYTVQVTLLLSTAVAHNVDAAGATAKNVGTYRQFTYTFAPGRGGTFTVFADVVDFRMPSVTMSGLFVEDAFLGDLGRFGVNLLGLQNAITVLRDTALSVRDDSGHLSGGIHALPVDDISGQIESINQGMTDTVGGAAAIFGTLAELNIAEQRDELRHDAWYTFMDLLWSAQTSVNSMRQAAGMQTRGPFHSDHFADELNHEMHLINTSTARNTIPQLIERLQRTRAFFDDFDSILNSVYDASGGAAALNAEAGQLNSVFLPFSEMLLHSFNALDAIRGESGRINDNIGEMTESIERLYYDANALVNLVTESLNLDDADSEFTPVSFVDERNDEVIEMVQFVIRMPAIEAARAENDGALPARRGFFRRLLDLFG